VGCVSHGTATRERCTCTLTPGGVQLLDQHDAVPVIDLREVA
jgi:hypothetical protein